jgi:hypothetical protein
VAAWGDTAKTEKQLLQQFLNFRRIPTITDLDLNEGNNESQYVDLGRVARSRREAGIPR